jgi:hypothetical protein
MKSALRETLESFFAKPKLSRFDAPEIELSTAEEAEEFCEILKENLHRPKHASRLIRAFQPEGEPVDEVVDVLRAKGTELLLQLEPKLQVEPGGVGDDRLFLLKMLAIYGTAEGADRVIALARSGYSPEAYLWSVIFGCFNINHPEAGRVFTELSSALPSSFAAVALLDAANAYMIAGGEIKHPFDSDEGVALLRGWLRDLDPDRFSYAHSATASLPFISNPPRDELLQLAMDHPDSGVSVEAEWAAAKIGMERGIRELRRYARNINTSAIAMRYLSELGREDAIPEECQEPEFQAMAEMVHWLSHPNEFGEPPTKITLYDSRELYWPPTDDRRSVWLFRYEYAKSENREEEDIGLGMVGSVTFALFGETTANLAPLEAYALHCCWELECNEDPRAPETRSVAAGLAILKRYNELPDIVIPEETPEAGEENESSSETEESENSLGEFLEELLGAAKEKRKTGKSSKRAVREAVRELMAEKTKGYLAQVEEFRGHLVAQRRSAPPVRVNVRPGADEVLDRIEVAERRAALELAGYRLKGAFEFVQIPDFAVVLFLHAENETVASICCGKEITTELAAYYADGREFYVRDTAAAPGLTQPPWTEYRYEPGRSVREIVHIFEASRSSGNQLKFGSDPTADLEKEFRRVQEWRMERGGWNREEVQAQLGVADASGHEDQIADACLNIREMWLYAWFKDNHPEVGDSLLEKLLIVHDEHEIYILSFLWVMGGGSEEVRLADFEAETPRETFSAVNESQGGTLKLVARKTGGYPADFYAPEGFAVAEKGSGSGR